MESFFICGFVLLVYAIRKFLRNKILYPSIIFSVMWGGGLCIYRCHLEWVWREFVPEGIL